MSATTFLLILAAVVVVFVGFLIKSWFELSNATRGKKTKREVRQDDDRDPE